MAVTTTSIIRCHLDKIIAQAEQIALLKAEKERYEKRANEQELRALQAEQERDTWRARYDKVVEDSRNPLHTIIGRGSVYMPTPTNGTGGTHGE